MAVYTFKNIETDEEKDYEMPMSELDDFEANNPDLRRVFKPILIADPINIGITKPDSTFQKYVLGKVKAKTGGKAIERRWHIPREI